MILEKMDVLTTLRKVQCGGCGGVYAISENYYIKKQETGGFWTCPYCNSRWVFYYEDTLLEKAQKEAQ